jgi:hypothetical protein
MDIIKKFILEISTDNKTGSIANHIAVVIGLIIKYLYEQDQLRHV